MELQEHEDESDHDVSQNLEGFLDGDTPIQFHGNGYYRDNTHDGTTSRRALGRADRKYLPGWGLQFEDLTYTVVKKQKIDGTWKFTNVNLLQGISGEAIKGQLTAIMGPSGAGKSTLLDALAGRIAQGSLGGTVRLDGQRMTDSYIQRNSAYVLQQDLLFPLLTVTETLLFSAEMHLPSSMPHFEKVDRVQALLMQLGLEHCADTKIGDEKHQGISGGEKRRVSIGVDIIHGPSLLFLDEPTSGLDSSSALTVVEKLFDIAGTGSTVLFTIHLPSYRIQMMLSRAIVLARGKVVYQGAPEELAGYLEQFGREIPRNVDNVEYLLDIIKEFEQSEAGLDPLVQFQRNGSKTAPKSTKSNGPLATMMFSKTPIVEEEADCFDYSLTSLRSPLTPGIKLAKSFYSDKSFLSYKPSWGLTPGRTPLRKDTYFTAGTAKSVVSTKKSGLPRGMQSPMVALGEGKSPSTPYSSLKGGSDDDLESDGCCWRSDCWRYQNGWFREVMLLMCRNCKNVIRTRELFIMQEVKAIIVSVLLATLFVKPAKDLDGVYQLISFFAFLNVLIILSSNDSLPTFIQERYIFMRETGCKAYRASTYTVSNLLVYLPISALHALTYVLIAWFALQLNGGFNGFCILVLILFVSIATANSFAMLVSALVPNLITGYAVVLGLTSFYFLTCGYFIKRSQIPAYWLWLHYMSTMKYSLEASLQNEFARGKCFSTISVPPAPGNLDSQSTPILLSDGHSPNCYIIGENVVDAFEMTQLSIWGCIAVIVAWCFLYRFLLYIVLRFYTKSQRK